MRLSTVLFGNWRFLMTNSIKDINADIMRLRELCKLVLGNMKCFCSKKKRKIFSIFFCVKNKCNNCCGWINFTLVVLLKRILICVFRCEFSFRELIFFLLFLKWKIHLKEKGELYDSRLSCPGYGKIGSFFNLKIINLLITD